MLTLWKPGKTSTFERAFDEFFRGMGMENYYETNFSPEIDVRETAEKVIIECELPGIEKDQVKLGYEAGYLKITGEKKYTEEKEDECCHRRERSYGSFQRMIPLNDEFINPDTIDAHFHNGLLTIGIEKIQIRQPERKEIQVKIS